MILRRLAASAPASITGLGCLYGVGGLAVEYARDFVVVEVRERRGVRVEVVDGEVPGGSKNTAYGAAKAFLEKTGLRIGLRIKVYKRIPVGIGLGSSDATAAATTYALNKMIGSELRAPELVEIAGQGELAAGGLPKYSGVATSLLGGLVVILNTRTLRMASLAPPDNLWVIIFTPHHRQRAADRESLVEALARRRPGFKTCIDQYSAVAELLIGVFEKNPSLIGDAVNRGGLVEESVASTIPGYWDAKDAALEAGAFGFNVSGLGPSTFALVSSDSVINVIEAVTRAFSRNGLRVTAKVVRPDLEGARLEDPDLLML